MPRYEDIQRLVRRKYGFAAQPCWISECKARVLGLPHPEKNRDGSTRKKQARSPLSKEKRAAIIEIMRDVGVPDGKRLED
jgi:hypothetical protein